MKKIGKITANTTIGDFGQMLESVRIERMTQKINREEILLKDCYVDCCSSISCKGVLSVEINDGDTLISFDPFLFDEEFSIEAAGITISKRTIDKINIKNEPLFGKYKENDVLYPHVRADSSLTPPVDPVFTRRWGMRNR